MFYLTAKFHEKVTNGLQDSAWHTYIRMDIRTDEGNSKGPSTDGGETKNQTIPVNQSEEKWENLIFEGIKGGLKGIKGLIQNPLETFLSPIHVLPNCQVSGKSNKLSQR